ncbi:MAG: hypothetical protein M1835_002326 [Candelina submexicana]|nr:MAG: hypothetical protein M1835_002326 [Candelina submexicana]
MRLSVHILPLADERGATLCPFLEVCSDNLELQELFHQIRAHHDRLYVHRRPLQIKKLQDAYGNDLDLAYTVCDVFSDRNSGDQMGSVVRVVQQPVDRESSILPQSTLRPQIDRITGLKRGRESNEFNGFQRASDGARSEPLESFDPQNGTGRADKKRKLLQSVADREAPNLDSDIPVLSCEIDRQDPRYIKSETSNYDDLHLIPKLNQGSPLLDTTADKICKTIRRLADSHLDKKRRGKKRSEKKKFRMQSLLQEKKVLEDRLAMMTEGGDTNKRVETTRPVQKAKAEGLNEQAAASEREQKKAAPKPQEHKRKVEGKKAKEDQEMIEPVVLTRRNEVEKLEKRITMAKYERQKEADEAKTQALELLRRERAKNGQQSTLSTTPSLPKAPLSITKTPSPQTALDTPSLPTKLRRSVSFAEKPLLSTGTGQTSSPTKPLSIIKTSPPKESKDSVNCHSWSKILPPGLDHKSNSPLASSRRSGFEEATSAATRGELLTNVATKPTCQPPQSSMSEILPANSDGNIVATSSPGIYQLKKPLGWAQKKAQKPSTVPAAQQSVRAVFPPKPDHKKSKPIPPSSRASNPQLPSSQPRISQPPNNSLPVPPRIQRPRRRIQTKLNITRDVKGKGRVQNAPSSLGPRPLPTEEIIISSGEESPISISSDSKEEEKAKLAQGTPFKAKAGPSDPEAVKAKHEAIKKAAKERIKVEKRKPRAPSPSVVITKQHLATAMNGSKEVPDMPSSPPISSVCPRTSAKMDYVQPLSLQVSSQLPRTPSTASEPQAVNDTPSPIKKAVHIQLDRHGSGVPIDGVSETQEVTTFPLRSGRIRSNSAQSPPKVRSLRSTNGHSDGRAHNSSQLILSQGTEQDLDNRLQQDARRSMETTPKRDIEKSKSSVIQKPLYYTLSELNKLPPEMDRRTNGQIFWGENREKIVSERYAAMRRYQASQAPKFPDRAGGSSSGSDSSEESEEEDAHLKRNPDMPKRFRGLFKSMWSSGPSL